MDLSSIFKDLGSVMEMTITIFTPKIFYSFAAAFLAVIVTIITLIFIKKEKKLFILSILAIEALTIIIMILISFGTADYPRNYLNKDSKYQLHEQDILLSEAADERGLYIGAAINLDQIEDKNYSSLISREFNAFTAENDMKWSNTLINGELGNYDFSKIDKYIEFAETNDMRLRGHALVWGKGYPTQLRKGLDQSDNKEQYMRDVLEEYISTMVGHYAGRIDVWDVVNEPIALSQPQLEENIFYEAMGSEYIAYAFNLAHKADPEAELFLNGYIGKDPEILLNLLQDLVNEGVPIDGFGLQGHTIFEAKDVNELAKVLQKISDLGLKVEITELDVRLRSLGDSDPEDIYETQGQYVREILEACMEIENFVGITFWGVDDSANWFDLTPPFSWMKPNDPLLFDINLEKKPMYYEVYDALKNQ